MTPVEQGLWHEVHRFLTEFRTKGPSVAFGNLQPHPCLQPDELENDPYPQMGMMTPTTPIGSPAIAGKATDDSPKAWSVWL